jgi:hypothetical protein
MTLDTMGKVMDYMMAELETRFGASFGVGFTDAFETMVIWTNEEGRPRHWFNFNVINDATGTWFEYVEPITNRTKAVATPAAVVELVLDSILAEGIWDKTY